MKNVYLFEEREMKVLPDISLKIVFFYEDQGETTESEGLFLMKRPISTNTS